MSAILYRDGDVADCSAFADFFGQPMHAEKNPKKNFHLEPRAENFSGGLFSSNILRMFSLVLELP